ncbi:hypothetical protein HY025_05340 [Candidatus Daviesbacteria bacterium]|nr:hypothetical protein [Candidatus Daviesbacteria bacterium]
MDKTLSPKTFIISHLLILLLSLNFLVGLYYILNKDQLSASVFQNYRPVTIKPVSFSMDVTSPDDETLVFDKSIVISGKTSPKATVIISSDDSNLGLQANGSGEFSQVIELSKGLNNFTIAAFDEKGNTKQVTRTIFYSEDKL